MPTELENSIRNAAAKIAEYVDDVTTMTVQTAYVQVGSGGEVDFSHARPVARTTIKMDGDSEVIIPMRQTQTGGFEVDAGLLDLHQRHVTTAIEYRARILNALLAILQPQQG